MDCACCGNTCCQLLSCRRFLSRCAMSKHEEEVTGLSAALAASDYATAVQLCEEAELEVRAIPLNIPMKHLTSIVLCLYLSRLTPAAEWRWTHGTPCSSSHRPPLIVEQFVRTVALVFSLGVHADRTMCVAEALPAMQLCGLTQIPKTVTERCGQLASCTRPFGGGECSGAAGCAPCARAAMTPDSREFSKFFAAAQHTAWSAILSPLVAKLTGEHPSRTF